MCIEQCDDTAAIDPESAAVVRRVIVEAVTIKQGCKANELIPDLLARLSCLGLVVRFSTHGIVDFIERMIEDGSLRAVEYVVPCGDYRVKRFLLPGAAHVEIHDVIRRTGQNGRTP